MKKTTEEAIQRIVTETYEAVVGVGIFTILMIGLGLLFYITTGDWK
jgi:hypothetical protein